MYLYTVYEHAMPYQRKQNRAVIKSLYKESLGRRTNQYHTFDSNRLDNIEQKTNLFNYLHLFFFLHVSEAKKKIDS